MSLFGPTDPAKLAPRVTHGVVLAAADFEAKSRAMRDIPVVAVERAVEALDARVDGVRAGR